MSFLAMYSEGGIFSMMILNINILNIKVDLRLI